MTADRKIRAQEKDAVMRPLKSGRRARHRRRAYVVESVRAQERRRAYRKAQILSDGIEPLELSLLREKHRLKKAL